MVAHMASHISPSRRLFCDRGCIRLHSTNHSASSFDRSNIWLAVAMALLQKTRPRRSRLTRP